ncbi:hypothetical protein [Pseudoxanthomonas sp. 10H]|uniref:hypothetical protein n=1 Tax=Pseudoxanthomonas sp. 10H TaxID=3242729 RepID=UPI003558BAB3
MRTILLAVAITLAAVACDRRNDPEVDRDSTAVSTPPGEAVVPSTTPSATLPPPAVPADCVGREGSEGCPPAADERVPTEPQPAQTPPEPR